MLFQRYTWVRYSICGTDGSSQIQSEAQGARAEAQEVMEREKERGWKKKKKRRRAGRGDGVEEKEDKLSAADGILLCPPGLQSGCLATALA